MSDAFGPRPRASHRAAISVASRPKASVTIAQLGDFQDCVDAWMDACFGDAIKADVQERCDRFIEEALEFVQAAGYSAERAHALVDYTFGRPQGEINQEVGGVMVTLAAMCNTLDVDISAAAEVELARVWTKIDAIRAKQAAKPTGSALPVRADPEGDQREIIRREIINTPETADFMAGVPIEAAHQRVRWPSEHDEGKSPFDWFWLIGYLAGKAAHAAEHGNIDKAKHHTISTAAALANWHCALAGVDNSMRPGIAEPRDRDAAEGGDANAAPVPKDQQARAESIAQKVQHD